MSTYFNSQILMEGSPEKLSQNELGSGLSDEIAHHDIQ